METNKDPNLHSGFIGEAMRNAEEKLNGVQSTDVMDLSENGTNKVDTTLPGSNEEINHNGIGKAPASVNAILDAQPPVQNITTKIINKEIMGEFKNTLQPKVVSGKNGIELENALRIFLETLPESVEIVKTEFGTTAAGLYVVVLYRNGQTRV